ncbi:MAG TPA: anaerobic glycerol-3-phosphate dehydrogenase subunit C [Pirellulales bacterium]|jgi:FAD/FMN-containing dehydrogenase/Fe-S oxidoreductase|nr:anaerobic glycerol-3-phosphate dehydrogenase subunit C [Pirellulales bacterium]
MSIDPERQRIEEDLRGLIAGDVRGDDVFVQMYASDASIYQIKPMAVVRPRTTSDVIAAVQYAAAHQLPVHARGAGTGLAGESLGPGLVIDFSSYTRRILRTDDDRVTLQPGVVHERLNAHLRRYGRQFGPDPAMSSVTTMGSVVAVDSSGSHWLKHGSARRHVLELELVLADGSLMRVGREPLVVGVSSDPDERKRALINSLAQMLARDAEVIARNQPRSLVNRCGYQLADIYTRDWLDVARLICGSEGTLALITEMTVATQPLPRHRNVALLLFESLDSAARAVTEILAFQPSACDLMDRRHLSLARENEPRFDPLIPAAAEAMLLVELESDDSIELRERLRRMTDRVRYRKKLAFDSRHAASTEEIEFFWLMSRRVTPTLARLKGSTRAIPFVEDMAVPPDVLPKFLVEAQNVLKRHQVTATLFGHAGHGQLHLRPFLDLSDPEQVRLMETLASELYDAVLAVRGSICGEHAAGLSRTPYLERQYGELCRVFREVKELFDPQRLLNPGKVIPDGPIRNIELLRPAWPMSVTPTVELVVVEESPGNGAVLPAQREMVDLQLKWSAADMGQMARACNGCGACRSQAAETRMCPIFRFAPSEEASPRAKANLVQAVLSGQLEPEAMLKDDFKAVADLCVNCKMCRLECPATIDIPKMMIEAKAQYVAADGLRLGDWALTRLDLFSALGSILSPLANWALTNRQMRWLLEKVVGLAQGRKVPRFTSRSFMRRAARRRLTRPTRRSGQKVLYFVDTYANYHDPQLGEALVAVFEHNGIAVYVPHEQTQSGMAMISVGAIAQAREVARHNVEFLAEAVRQGYTIVCSEPSAALCLSQEYPTLLDDEDTRLVAANTVDACAYLWNLHLTGKLQLDMRPLNVVVNYHQPCHVKALGVGTPGLKLLRLVPGLIVQHLDRGCSGMAGMFGLKKKNYRNSLRAGWPLISALRESSAAAGTTECSACKMQMEQGTRKPTVHPLKLLALAYNILPRGRSPLTAAPQELTVS